MLEHTVTTAGIIVKLINGSQNVSCIKDMLAKIMMATALYMTYRISFPMSSFYRYQMIATISKHMPTTLATALHAQYHAPTKQSKYSIQTCYCFDGMQWLQIFTLSIRLSNIIVSINMPLNIAARKFQQVLHTRVEKVLYYTPRDWLLLSLASVKTIIFNDLFEIIYPFKTKSSKAFKLYIKSIYLI